VHKQNLKKIIREKTIVGHWQKLGKVKSLIADSEKNNYQIDQAFCTRTYKDNRNMPLLEHFENDYF
jgi:hypothetical protein